MKLSVIQVHLTWAECYEFGSFYRAQMQHCAELANNLAPEFPSLRQDMINFADEAADKLARWDAVIETFYRDCSRMEIAA